MTEIAAAESGSHRFSLRILGGVLSGVLAGVFLTVSFTVGVEQYFPEELTEEARRGSNNFYFWGSHYILRVIASLVATSCGGYIAGVIARRHGRLAAALSALPSEAVWLFAAVLAFQGSQISYMPPGSRWVAALLAAFTVPSAIHFGALGELEGSKLAGRFDSRRRSVLGIAWFHCLWLTPIAYVVAVSSAWSILYYGHLVFALWQGNDEPVFIWQLASRNGLFRILGGALSFGVLGSVYLMVGGVFRAYRALAGIEQDGSPRAVILSGCGLPLLGALLIALCNLALMGLSKLLK